MIYRLLTALCAFIVILTTGSLSASAQGAQKIGWIDLQRVYEEAPAFTQVSNRLQSERDRRQQELEKKRTSIVSKIDEFQISREMLPEKTAEQRMKELQLEQQSFFKEMQEEQIELEQLKDQNLQPLIQRLKTAVETVAKQEGYGMIFKKFYMAYGAPQFDITDKVIAQLR